MPGRPILAGYSILRTIVSGVVVVYFGYLLYKISVTLNRIAASLEQSRVDRAGPS